MIRTDRGMVFRSIELNIHVYLQDQHIHHFYALNTETKANYSERLIKTLKHKLFRYMMKNKTQRYVDVLQYVVHSYSHTVHRSLGDKLSVITKAKEGKVVCNNIYWDKSNLRISLRKTRANTGLKWVKPWGYLAWRACYTQKWTGKVFKIYTRLRREGVPVYTLLAWDGEKIEGVFYEPEIQAVNVDESTELKKY